MGFIINRVRKEGFERVPTKLLQNSYVLSSAGLRVLLSLCSYSPCYISYNGLMQDTGIGNRRTIAGAIKELEDLSIIIVERHRKGTAQANNTYTVRPVAEWKVIWDDEKSPKVNSKKLR